MADGVNKVILIGNLGADPELRMTNGGEAVMNLRLAVGESWLDKNKQRQEKTEWVSVVFWGKRAEGLATFVSKGMQLYVEGSLQTRSYEDRDGNKRYTTEVKAYDVKVLTKKGDGTPRARETRGGSDPRYDESDDDRQQSLGATDDDIPF